MADLIGPIKSGVRRLKRLLYSRNIIFNSNNFSIGKGSKMKADSTSQIVFDGKICIECNVIFRAIEHGRIQIGNDVFISDYSTIRASDYSSVVVGDNTMIAQSVKLISTNHAYIKKDILIKDQHIIDEKKGIVIGSDCWIGAGTVILPGVSLGNGVVIGANSVVTKNIPSYAVAAGNPAKVFKFRQ
jgi:acetyltransferase-like isoleucine patch superfamily enzyme